MSGEGYFTRGTFAFLRELAMNNDRAWFAGNRQRYEEEVKEPAVRFIMDFAPSLKDISPHFKADPRSTGGSLFRIHRDVRFSRDKSPFKTHTGIQFRHDQGKDAHAPGFYLHVEPGGSFVGLGTWRPDGHALRKIREGLVADPAGWRRATQDRGFKGRFTLSGESLLRPPRGFDPAHPLVEDLKRKDFVALAPLSDSEVVAGGFLDDFAGFCRTGTPFMAFLCKLLEVPF